jgi:hypothetical protein
MAERLILGVQVTRHQNADRNAELAVAHQAHAQQFGLTANRRPREREGHEGGEHRARASIDIVESVGRHAVEFNALRRSASCWMRTANMLRTGVSAPARAANFWPLGFMPEIITSHYVALGARLKARVPRLSRAG